jgi:S-adenosylmethionine:tRNA ribosyltransferase-isomerase
MEIVVASSGCAEASLTLSDFQFRLPAELIAQTPAPERDGARLLVLDRRSGGSLDTQIRALPAHLLPGDLLVVNDTRVVPARAFGRTTAGAAVEVLFVQPTTVADEAAWSPARLGTTFQRPASWLCLGKPARRLREGTQLTFPGNVGATVAAVHGDGRYRLQLDADMDVPAWLAHHGELPLPPYIRRPEGPLPVDQARYQTIFAARAGAVAAPTAGLHFTEPLLAALRHRDIDVAHLTLHVGPGTFQPLRSADVRQHVMEPEWCEIPASTAAAIRRVKACGGRVVAVGTTTTRALESAASDDGTVQPGPRWADLFVVPGHRFRVIDALFTNFHLPWSTLILLVSAFAGRTRLFHAYDEAIRRGYRFYSYGDAMLIQ